MSSDIYRLETQDAESFPACGSQLMVGVDVFTVVIPWFSGHTGFCSSYFLANLDDRTWTSRRSIIISSRRLQLIENIVLFKCYFKFNPRVANFPLMKDPFAVTLILFAYLVFVLHIGPRYMKNRKPYKLNNFLILYNGLLAIASGVTCYGILTSGYTTNLSLGCEPYYISYEPEPLRMAGWVWWVFIMKVVELSDTIVFVLRKKFNQTSFLHVYHHATTAFMSWVTCKYVPAGMWTFVIIPNCMVHVIMYIYYLLAACGPEVREIINPAKKYITKLQMVQFTVMLIHTAQALMPSCDPNRKYLACLYAFQVIVMFYMFCGFYKKSYTEKKLE
ncbi:hypothetical protein M0802_000480 [Mischocyttarus mexicanus]|nr:hypothetical protein M0802_000480 [Mischocyttarus mexicanus]